MQAEFPLAALLPCRTPRQDRSYFLKIRGSDYTAVSYNLLAALSTYNQKGYGDL